MLWSIPSSGKRVLALFLAALLIFVFAGCSSPTTDEQTRSHVDWTVTPTRAEPQTPTLLLQTTAQPVAQDNTKIDQDANTIRLQVTSQPDERDAHMDEHASEPEEAELNESSPFRADHGHPAPPDAMAKAIAHLQVMRNMPSVGLAGAGIQRQHWEWTGPTAIGGRIYAIVIHPTVQTTMWVSSPAGGIWKTMDGGASWQPLDDFMASLNISALLIDPNNPDTLYASTGDLFELGAGIFRSTDGGTSWQQLDATIPANNHPQWAHMTRLAIAPDRGTLLASTAIPDSDHPSNGIWRSVDGGANWIQTLHEDGIIQVAFHAVDGHLAFASGFGKAWYSVDGGATWQASSGLPASPTAWRDYDLRAELAVATSNSKIIYASVNKDKGELWKSSDGGQTYALVNNNTPYVRYGDQAGLWVDPTNPNIVVVGGIDAWRSTDGGVTLTQITTTEHVHADKRAIVSDVGFNGSSNRTVYFGTDGGLYKTTDVYAATPKSEWLQLNTNLGVTQFFTACSSAGAQTMAGGTADNGTLRFDRVAGWTQAAGGDGQACAMNGDTADPLYGQYQNMGIWRRGVEAKEADNINGNYTHWDGSKWVTMWKPIPYQIPDAVPDANSKTPNTNFSAPLALDPHDPNRLLTGGLSIWRTNDATTPNTPSTGPTWASIKSPLPPTSDNTNYGRLVSVIAVAPSNSDDLWIGYNNGSVYKTTNATSDAPTWQPVGDKVFSHYGVATQLLIDSTDTRIVYATFDGYEGKNVWRTVDGGETWTSLTGIGGTALPDVPIYTIAVNPNNPPWLYVGTEVGLFTSQDGGKTWFLPQDGPANVAVHKLLWLGQTLVAATNGRGVYRTTLSGQPAMRPMIYLPLVTH